MKRGDDSRSWRRGEEAEARIKPCKIVRKGVSLNEDQIITKTILIMIRPENKLWSGTILNLLTTRIHKQTLANWLIQNLFNEKT